MTKLHTFLATMAIAAGLLTLAASCGSNSNDAQTVIDKYCELNRKEHAALPGAEKEAAAAERKSYEKEVDDKYFKDNEMYQLIMSGMKKCDEALAGSAPTAAASASDNSDLSSTAYGDAVTAANGYCALIDKSIAAAQNGSDGALKEVVAAKLIFEKNMEASFKDNPARRDSILRLVEPCMAKEVKFQRQ